eukprot:748963-Rhodomonas_salina.4
MEKKGHCSHEKCAFRLGLGSTSTRRHSLHVIGAISNIVVTLSRKAETRPVTPHSSASSRALSPSANLPGAVGQYRTSQSERVGRWQYTMSVSTGQIIARA